MEDKKKERRKPKLKEKKKENFFKKKKSIDLVTLFMCVCIVIYLSVCSKDF